MIRVVRRAWSLPRGRPKEADAHCWSKNCCPGVKILMSGGTRCNITQSTDNRGIIKAYGVQGPFLHSALAALSVADTLDLFHAAGVPTFIEDTNSFRPATKPPTCWPRCCAAWLIPPVKMALEAVVGLERVAERWHVTTNARDRLRKGDRHDRWAIVSGLRHHGRCVRLGRAGAYGRHTTSGARADYDQRSLVATTCKARPFPRSAYICKSSQPAASADPSPRDPHPSKPAAKTRGEHVLAEPTRLAVVRPLWIDRTGGADVSGAVSGHARPHSLLLRCDFLPATPRPSLEETWPVGPIHRRQEAALGSA